MFLSLLLVTLLTAVGVSLLVMFLFSRPITGILGRIIADAISAAWVKYMKFAIVVVGVSSGIRVYDLERYLPDPATGRISTGLVLTQERWILELYRTIIESLQGCAWLLLVFYVFALVAYVIVRLAEMRRGIGIVPPHDAEA